MTENTQPTNGVFKVLASEVRVGDVIEFVEHSYVKGIGYVKNRYQVRVAKAEPSRSGKTVAFRGSSNGRVHWREARAGTLIKVERRA